MRYLGIEDKEVQGILMNEVGYGKSALNQLFLRCASLDS